jgi:hypothetical protein
MSIPGSAGLVSPKAGFRPQRSPVTLHLILSGLLVLVTLAMAVAEFGHVAAPPRGPGTTSALFSELQPRFRDHIAFTREIKAMTQRAETDRAYLDQIAKLLAAGPGGTASMLDAFTDLSVQLDLDPDCVAGNPWSPPVSSARRDIDTAADGSRRVALDLLFCPFTVSERENAAFRYPVGVATLGAAESRHMAAIHSHLSADDARNALLWLQAVMKGEVGYLERLSAFRQASTSTLSEEISGALEGYLAANGAGRADTLVRAALLLVLAGLSAASVWLALRERAATNR